MKILRDAFSLLTLRERRMTAGIVALICVKGVFDTISIASVMPFLTVLTNPGIVESDPLARTAYEYLGVSSVDEFIVVLGIGLVVLILLSSAVRILTVFALNRFVFMRQYTLSRRVLAAYLRRPYEYFLSTNSGDMTSNILYEVQRVVAEALRPVSEVINHGITLIFVCALLLWNDPFVAILAFCVLSFVYLIIFLGVRPLLRRMSNEIAKANSDRFRIAGEAFGGIKQLKVSGREAVQIERFAAPAMSAARIRGALAFLRQAPRFGLDALAMGGVVGLTLLLLARHGGTQAAAFQSVIPTLGLYAFAAYRLMPAMQGIFAAVGALRFSASAVETVKRSLDEASIYPALPKTMAEPMRLTREIVLNDVSYSYDGASGAGITDVSLNIKAGSSVGIAGLTGAGKTTLMDALLGLLVPQGGTITVDGTPLTDENRRSWQASVGYVPQDIYLADTSIRRNIAMNVPEEELDDERVVRAAKMAQLHDFIMSELPDGFETEIGERGVRLSGGQRQRIGVARALYHDPDLLVFDEATSALDTITESQIMEEIAALARTKTIVMIAHRISTLRNCDQIVVMAQGRVVNTGSFAALSEQDNLFKTMARQAG